jgi:cob(I)alamin adenosyltransferase
MANRLSRIYTRTGDAGTTGLGDGSRVSKSDLRVQAMGEVDELNAVLGMLLAEALPEDVRDCLQAIQHDLFDMGGELSMPGHTFMQAGRVAVLEQTLDGWNAELSPLKEFILPGGSRAAAVCHLARTVCRRAERVLHALHAQSPVTAVNLQYLNRLSDLLFVLCRTLNRHAGLPDVLWNNQHKL